MNTFWNHEQKTKNTFFFKIPWTLFKFDEPFFKIDKLFFKIDELLIIFDELFSKINEFFFIFDDSFSKSMFFFKFMNFSCFWTFFQKKLKIWIQDFLLIFLSKVNSWPVNWLAVDRWTGLEGREEGGDQGSEAGDPGPAQLTAAWAPELPTGAKGTR